jgi:hypothetical protein
MDMIKVKIHTILLLFVFVSISVSAQNKQTKNSTKGQSSPIQQNAPRSGTQIDTLSPDYRIEQLKKSISKRDTVLQNTKKDKDKMPLLLSQNAECDSIIFHMQKIIDQQRADYKDLQSRLSALEIYEFLNRHDVNVFTDDLPTIKTPLSVCSQRHLLLIEKISSVNDVLSRTLDKISDKNISKFATENSVSTNEARDFLCKSAEKELLDADAKMSEIDKMDLSVLSDEQKRFYKETLLEKYREIYKKIYPKK